MKFQDFFLPKISRSDTEVRKKADREEINEKKISSRVIIFLLIPIFGIIGCSDDGENYYLTDSNCRTYATQYIAYGDGITNGFPNMQAEITVNCHFDKTTLQLICYADYLDQYQEKSIEIKTWLYESVSDFIEESKIVGKKLYISCEVDDNGCCPINIIHGDGFSHTNIFDDQKKLISVVLPLTYSDLSIDYIEWDSNGRPTQAEPTGICTDDEGTRYEYDDSLNIVTSYFNTRTSTRPPDMSVPCIQIHNEIHFDEDGNVILKVLNGTSTVFYDIVATDIVCN